jgi:MerR family mercuric resistance operon transcriptional regulator
MRIGELATEAGVNLQTIRFYERRGLLKEPPRLISGYRIYPPETVRTVRFIKRCQKLGFTLAEIADFLQEREQRSTNGARVRAIAEAKIENIDERIRGLQNMRNEISRLLTICTCGIGLPPCPAFEVISRDESLPQEPSRTRITAHIQF